MCRVYFVTETAQIELRSGRVYAPATAALVSALSRDSWLRSPGAAYGSGRHRHWNVPRCCDAR